jgi:hypothetical protein
MMMMTYDESSRTLKGRIKGDKKKKEELVLI